MNPQKNIVLATPGDLGLFGKTCPPSPVSTSNNTFRNILIGGTISVGLGLCLYLYYQYSHTEEKRPPKAPEPVKDRPLPIQPVIETKPAEVCPEECLNLAPIVNLLALKCSDSGEIISFDAAASPIPEIDKHENEVDGYWLIY